MSTQKLRLLSSCDFDKTDPVSLSSILSAPHQLRPFVFFLSLFFSNCPISVYILTSNQIEFRNLPPTFLPAFEATLFPKSHPSGNLRRSASLVIYWSKSFVDKGLHKYLSGDNVWHKKNNKVSFSTTCTRFNTWHYRD